ncbi:VOC family protein [Streptomyces roseoverticillatus]|uniref:VOC family protein n=1 Tax=Streptomyces roseoverticillatus TaxID=66429 RepID=UPI0006949D00|nr:VOC family protein [Streptomyces roseoverticillatus]
MTATGTKETLQLFTPMLYVRDSLEAIAFYTDVFGVEEISERTMLLSQVPGMDKTPGADRTVVYSKLQFGDGSALSVAELYGTPQGSGDHVIGNNIHIGLQYTDPGEQRTAFDKLAEGGKVLETLETKFWGVAYGIVQDKYGVIWESNCYLTQGDGDEAAAPA